MVNLMKVQCCVSLCTAVVLKVHWACLKLPTARRIMGMGRWFLSEGLQSGTTHHFVEPAHYTAHAQVIHNDTIGCILPSKQPMKAMSVVLESSHRALSIGRIISLIGRLLFNQVGQKRV